MKKRGIVSLLVIFFLFFSVLAYAEDDEEGIDFKEIYDLKENQDWNTEKEVILNVNNASIINFNIIEESCSLTVTSLQKISKNIIFQLTCESVDQPVIVRQGTSRTLDLDDDNKNDLVLNLKSFIKREDRASISVKQLLIKEENGSASIITILIILVLAGIGVYYYFSNKTSKTAYEKIKQGIEQLENNLSLKEYDKAKQNYQEVKNYYPKLTLSEQKELKKRIDELFKQFEKESKK